MNISNYQKLSFSHPYTALRMIRQMIKNQISLPQLVILEVYEDTEVLDNLQNKINNLLNNENRILVLVA